MLKTILKILGIVLIVCIVSLCAIILVGGHDTAEPEMSDLMPQKQTVPEDQNAFDALNTVADAIVLPADLNPVILYLEGQEIYTALIEKILLKNITAFASIDEAMIRSRCVPPENLNPGTYIAKWYRIGLLLGMQAVNDRQTGQLEQSTQRNITLMQFSNMVQRDARTLSDYSAGVKLLRLGLEQAGALARTDEINLDPLMLLAETLTTLGPFDEGLQQAYRSKFHDVINQIDNFRSSKKSIEQTFSDTQSMPYLLRKIKWFPGYMLKENYTKQKLAKLYRDTIENVSRNYGDMNLYDMEHYLGLEGSRLSFFYKPNFVGKLFYAFTTPEIKTQLGIKCQMQGTLAAAQLIVALNSFEKENNKVPDQLTDLVPKYLAELPMDPFNGQPWHYLPGKRIIYSVSEDLKDSGGSSELPEGAYFGKDYPRTWVALDAVFEF